MHAEHCMKRTSKYCNYHPSLWYIWSLACMGGGGGSGPAAGVSYVTRKLNGLSLGPMGGGGGSPVLYAAAAGDHPLISLVHSEICVFFLYTN